MHPASALDGAQNRDCRLNGWGYGVEKSHGTGRQVSGSRGLGAASKSGLAGLPLHMPCYLDWKSRMRLSFRWIASGLAHFPFAPVLTSAAGVPACTFGAAGKRARCGWTRSWPSRAGMSAALKAGSLASWPSPISHGAGTAHWRHQWPQYRSPNGKTPDRPRCRSGVSMKRLLRMLLLQNGISSSISEKFGAGRGAGRLPPPPPPLPPPAFWRAGGALP